MSLYDLSMFSARGEQLSCIWTLEPKHIRLSASAFGDKLSVLTVFFGQSIKQGKMRKFPGRLQKVL